MNSGCQLRHEGEKMAMKIVSSCGMFLWLSCMILAVHGQRMNEGASVVVSQSKGTPFPIAQVEPIPALSSEKSTVNAKDSIVAFEIYFGGSACDEPAYIFEKVSDSLHLVQEHGKCYRHGKLYGIRGTIKGLAPGKYVLAVIRRFRKEYAHANPPLIVFQKKIALP